MPLIYLAFVCIVCIGVLQVSTGATIDRTREAVTFVGKKGSDFLNEVEDIEMVVNGCQCSDYSCGCCEHVEEEEIHLNSTICTNVTYLKEDYGISFTVTLNNFTLYNATVSVHNPPPVCLGMPYVKQWAEVCIRLHDINTSHSQLHACVRVEARMKKVLVAKYELGCFTIRPPYLEKAKHMIDEVENEIFPSVILM